MKFIDFPSMNVKIEGMENISIPKMMKIRQIYDSFKIENLKEWIEREMENNLSHKENFKGKRICITVGSRGIPDLDIIVRTIVDKLKEWKAEPFIIPAMGSHAGGTAEGQKDFIAGYNITEKTMGVPILSSMEVVKIGQLPDETPVYCDKNAYESDGIVVLNKVKPHTDFRGKHESGMAKMMAIGLAKHKGASMFHMKGFSSFAERIPQVCDIFLKNAPVAFGVGIVQNAYDEISNLEVMEKAHILERDAALLKIAKEKIAKFKMPSIDVLIIDEIGKNISGNGFDPNIVGRSNSPGFDDVIDLKKLFIRGLTEETHHNGCGLSNADITTIKCVRDVDYESTWINVSTATMLNGGRIPMYANSDREALLIAIRTCTGIDFDKVKVVHIKNTSSMDIIEVSESYYDELKNRDDVEILSKPEDIKFDKDGFMI
ncbi:MULTISPECIES: lactate racemase domain-containing protein [Clostridium]|uniref:Lactate racemase domain-containing protein n=1 Tax=Clostridium lapidicellarium TaxID=3240931 RepID=A0ABV4DS41_9CLOT|nr:lactate racemase domain-containing protein [uncultured Clostridium sp.]